MRALVLTIKCNYHEEHAMFKRIKTAFYTYKLIDRLVNSQYTIKITAGLGMDCDRNSDAQAKNETVKMILSNEIDKNDIGGICETYMNLRVAIVMGNGGMARWVKK